MKESVSVSAPGKLMLLGEHAVIYDKPCLVTAVDQRLSCDIERLSENNLEINSPDVGIENYSKSVNDLGSGDVEKGAKFIEFAVRNFRDVHGFDGGVSISSKSEFKHTFGFGSSSAVTVCVAKGLSELLGLNLSDQEIFDLSYKTVIDVQGVGSGFDIAAAVYGGTVYFVTGGKEIEPLDVKDFDLVVGYSGTKADTATIVKEIAKKRDQNKHEIDGIFSEIEVLVEKGKICMNKSNWEGFGRIMNENQVLLYRLGVSTEKLDAMISAAVSAGAYGAKLSGAGGGDCMIALVANSTKQTVQRAVEKAGGEVIDVKVNAEGVKI